MTIEKSRHIARYACRRKPTTPEERKKIMDRVRNPYTLSGIDKLRAVYELHGLEFDEAIIESVIEQCASD